MIGTVIVSFNSAKFLDDSIRAAARFTHEVVVVDNASEDDSVEVAARAGAKVLSNPVNRGFAAAVNQGVRSLRSEFALILNPDTVLVNSPAPLAEACQLPGVGAAAGRLAGPDGHTQTGFTVRRLPTTWTLSFEALGINRVWPSNPVNRSYRCLDLDLRVAQQVEQPAGAFLLFSKKTWEELGGLDESFHPVWFEDVDLLARMQAANLMVWYDPDVVASHHGGHSVSQLDPGIRQTYWYGNLLRYAAKHFSPFGFRATAAAAAAGCVIRWAATGIREYGSLAWLAGARVFGAAPAVRLSIGHELKKETKEEMQGC